MLCGKLALTSGPYPAIVFQLFRTCADQPPRAPADAHGNFLPLPAWKPGQPRPADWPPHIHPPREVAAELGVGGS